jgi:hypothetical protein
MRHHVVPLALALCAACGNPQQQMMMMNPPPPPPVENCLGKQLLESFSKTKLLVGYRTDQDSIATQAPWDVRYDYITAGIADGPGPCQSCANNCNAGGWWGCWQDFSEAPGAYVRNRISEAKANGQIAMFTYYQQLYSTNAFEGSAQILKMKDSTIMSRYFNDYRFMLQQIGMEKAIVHLEPDTWGYGQQANADPTKTEVAVASANATDCGSLGNDFQGFGKCMIAMTRKYAPNAKVGFHASSWATNTFITGNTDPSFDVVAETKKTAAFLEAIGAADGDFVAVEASDRDSGFYAQNGDANAVWDPTNVKLPNFKQAFTYAKTISEEVGRPLLWWQLPVGNASTHYTDNRVDYFFAHTDEVAATHAVLMAFGAGKADQTEPATDNGNLINKTKAYVMSGGQAMTCP